MNIQAAISRTKANAPMLLSGTSIIGVVATAYLSALAGHKHARRLGEEAPDLPPKEVFKKVWKFYIPPSISGAATITSIVANTRVNARRTAAAQAAFVVAERAFSEYKDHVLANVGETTEQKIRDKIAQDRVDKEPPSQEILMLAGPGNVLCCELYTGRYFTSDMETLRKTQNEINERILHFDYQTLSDWYDKLGIPYTDMSDDFGWTTDKLMDLQFTTTLAQNGTPCLAFTYNYIKQVR